MNLSKYFALAPMLVTIVLIGCGESDGIDTPQIPKIDDSGTKPQIPKEDFEWNGTFKAVSMGIDTNLVISGKWDDDNFNLYMEQGKEGSGAWVQNFIYENRFYTITHEWPGGVKLPGCFRSQVGLTVDGLNGILKSSRLVGLEQIDGVDMNHFRTTCLSQTTPVEFPYSLITAPLNVFSDIYVQPGLSSTFERWLQYGDGVGLDSQHDEWFILDKDKNDEPDNIILPEQCKVGNVTDVYQWPCSNL